jgi:hypothetical protein
MKWINVKKRLPKIDVPVLVCLPSGFDGSPRIAFGARVDGGEGWCWGLQYRSYGGLDPKTRSGILRCNSRARFRCAPTAGTRRFAKPPLERRSSVNTPVAQWTERPPSKRQVEGSTPSGRAT